MFIKVHCHVHLNRIWKFNFSFLVYLNFTFIFYCCANVVACSDDTTCIGNFLFKDYSAFFSFNVYSSFTKNLFLPLDGVELRVKFYNNELN